jgi:hypothetical protein
MKMDDQEFNEKLGRKKSSLLSSEALENSIKNLTNPRFLGSIHIKNMSPTQNFSSVDSLLQGELELKINKSLKNTIFNPVTKILILSMIIFNILWITLFFLL